MKKLFLLLLTVTFLSVSCSSDDDDNNDPVPPANSFKVKIDGVMTDFPTITASNPQGSGDMWSYFARINASHQFSFISNSGSTGNTGFLVFGYTVGGVTYTVNASSNNITENTDTKLVGTWSGTAVDGSGDVAFTFTEGSYMINH